MSKLAGLAAAAAILLCGCDLPSTLTPASQTGACPPRGDGRTHVDYVDFVRHAGRTYTVESASPAPVVPRSALGAQVGSVACELSKINPEPGHDLRDGDAAFLAAGTALYEIRGYPGSFRLAALQAGSYRIYEVDTAPEARIGSDLLPIAGKVRQIEVLDGFSATKVLARVTDPREIATLVDAIVTARVEQDHKVSSDPLFLRFTLADGTAVQRAWFQKDSIVSRGILVPRSFTLALQRKIVHK